MPRQLVPELQTRLFLCSERDSKFDGWEKYVVHVHGEADVRSREPCSSVGERSRTRLRMAFVSTTLRKFVD